MKRESTVHRVLSLLALRHHVSLLTRQFVLIRARFMFLFISAICMRQLIWYLIERPLQFIRLPKISTLRVTDTLQSDTLPLPENCCHLFFFLLNELCPLNTTISVRYMSDISEHNYICQIYVRCAMSFCSATEVCLYRTFSL